MLGKSMHAWAVLAALGLGGAAEATQSVVVTWNEAALEEVRRGRLGPPIVARALAVAHTCMYDAWTHYDTRAVGLVTPTGTQRRPVAEHTEHNKKKTVSHAAYRCLLNLFPAGEPRLTALMQSLGYDPNNVSTDLLSAPGIGNAAAAAVIASRRDDGSNQYGEWRPGAYSDYQFYTPANPPMPFCLPTFATCVLNTVNPYRWQPLINNLGVTQSFIAPHWENVRPFALSSAWQFDHFPEVVSGPNYLRSAAAYEADINQMLAFSAGLTPQQKLIVEYWADGPESELPPGHWSLFAQHVSRRDGNSVDKDVKMFFAMQNASFDAGILAWHMKRKYDGVRPITAVRNFRQGVPVVAWGGPGQPIQTIDGGKWTPYNPGSNLTPAFPGFVSGHSTFSAASATVLRSFTGSDAFNFSTVIPANFGRVEPGVPAVPTAISYPTFSSAVADAGLSRLLGGIHFSDDNTAGQALGNRAGQLAWAKAQFLFDGGVALTNSSYGRTENWSLSWSHTTASGNNRLLLVGVATTDDSSSANSVTYGGVQMSRLGAQNGPSGDNRVELWYLVAPPAGTATVRVNLANNNDIVAGALSFIGVQQSAPFGVLRAAANSTTAACVTLANEPAPLVASVLAVNSDAGNVSAGSGQTLRWEAVSDFSPFPMFGGGGGGGGAFDIIGTGMTGPGAPSANICQHLSNGRRWALLAVPLKPAY